jgi:hypothetical protein
MIVRDNDGLTTVECLIALLILAIGVLGSAATTALALRAEAAGERAATAARLVGSVLDSLRGVVAAGGGRCSGVGSGSVTGTHGTAGRWAVAQTAGGREVALVLAFPAMGRVRAETAWTFLPCR